MSASPLRTKRDDYFQMWRGICIVAVVLIHALPFQNTPYYILMRNVINFPVAVFFALSGYFVKPADFQGSACRSTLIKRTKRLLIPYAVYTVVYFVLNVAMGKSVTLSYVLCCLFLGEAATPLYYVLVLCMFTWLTPVLIRLLHSKAQSCLLCGGCCAALLGAYVLQLCGVSVWFYVKYTVVWLPFYYIGMIIRQHNVTFERLRPVNRWLVLAAFLLQLVESYFLYRIPSGSPIAFSQIRLSAFLYAFSLLIFMFLNRKPFRSDAANAVRRVLSKLGDQSYGIYFIHFAPILIGNLLIDKFRLPLHGGLIVGALSILLSLLCITLLKRLFKKNSQLIFGV